MHGGVHCAVASCVHHTQLPDESTGMVNFPTDDGELTNVWMQRCGVHHVVPGITRICARHFQPDDFTYDQLWQRSNPGQPNPRPLVRPGAVPSRQLALNPFSWSMDDRHTDLVLDVQSAAPPVKRKRMARGRPSSRRSRKRPQLSPTERFDPEVRASLVQAAIEDYEVRKKDSTSTDWNYVSRTASGLSAATKRRPRRGSGRARRSRRPITTLRDDPICRGTLQNGFDSVGESLWMDVLSSEVNDQKGEIGERDVKLVSTCSTSSSAQVINVNFIVEPQLRSPDYEAATHNFEGGMTTATTSTRTSTFSDTQPAQFSIGSAAQTVSVQDMIDEDDKEFRFRLPHWMPDRSRELLLWRRHLQRMTRRLDKEGRRSDSRRLLVLRDDILADAMDAGPAGYSLQPPFADSRTSPSTLVDALEVLHRQRLENMQMRATMLLANMRHRRLAARLEQAGISSDWPAETEKESDVAGEMSPDMSRCEWTEFDLQRARELSNMCTAEAYNYVKEVFKVPLPNLDVLTGGVPEEGDPGGEIARGRGKNRGRPPLSSRKRCSSGNSLLVQEPHTFDEVTAPLSWDFDWNHLGSTNYGAARQSEAVHPTHHGHFEAEDNDRVLKIEEAEAAADLALQNIVFDPSLMIESSPFVTADRCNRTLDISKTDAKLSSQQITKSGVPVDVVRRNQSVSGGAKVRDFRRLTHARIRPSQCALSWLDP